MRGVAHTIYGGKVGETMGLRPKVCLQYQNWAHSLKRPRIRPKS